MKFDTVLCDRRRECFFRLSSQAFEQGAQNFTKWSKPSKLIQQLDNQQCQRGIETNVHVEMRNKKK